MVDLPKIEPDAVNDLLFLAKRLKGVISLIPVLESGFSLDQAIAERSTQLFNLDQQVLALGEQKARLDAEIIHTDERILKMLAEAQVKYNSLIEQGQTEAKLLIEKARGELSKQVTDLTLRLEELKTQNVEMKNLIISLDREIKAREDKLANVNYQIQEFRRSI